MKVNPELGNVIKIVAKETEEQYARKTQDKGNHEMIEDIVSVENKKASRSRIENVEEAKKILSFVTKDMESASSGLYSLNFQRISRMIG
ncbi:MAG TPA: hypothetical protein VN416_05555 [Desulfomonilia bacterium]|jgi:ArsR family metal-binding transcriptional regulator|nr:hypothetical protein [Desulfomonilia bacterium]